MVNKNSYGFCYLLVISILFLETALLIYMFSVVKKCCSIPFNAMWCHFVRATLYDFIF